MPATPALMCTTVPPAKSSAPSAINQPPPQTQWQIGAYTNNTQRAVNTIKLLNLIRSAIEPAKIATVIMAKVI